MHTEWTVRLGARVSLMSRKGISSLANGCGCRQRRHPVGQREIVIGSVQQGEPTAGGNTVVFFMD